VPELRFLVVFFIVVCLPVAAELVVAAGFVIVGIKKLLALKKIKRLFLLFRELYSIILFFDEKFKSYKKKRV
jgi:purine-cytosine permease-like protein